MVINSSPDSAHLIGVVGSARIEQGDHRWQRAYDLGAALGARGWRVMTGGYGGLMEAAARGAHENGAKVIGLPMRAWSELTPNRWSAELRWAADYSERLRELLGCDAVVALDGGIGTLTEVAVTWSALQTEPDAAHLVVLGTAWKRLLDLIRGEFVVGSSDLGLVHLVDDVGAAVSALECLLDAQSRRGGLPRG